MNVDAMIHHAGWVLFVWVFVNQSGVPVPVVPSLVAAGALASRGGSSCAVMLAAAAGAALVADMVWYGMGRWRGARVRSEEHTSELQSRVELVCRLLLEKKKSTRLLCTHEGSGSAAVAMQ